MSFSAPTSRAQRSRRILLWLLYLYALVLFAMHFVRIFDNSFWGDEGFSIGLAQKMIQELCEKIVQRRMVICRCDLEHFKNIHLVLPYEPQRLHRIWYAPGPYALMRYFSSLYYHTAAKDDIAKRPKAAKMFCGGKMDLHFQQKQEHLQAILPRDVHFDERTLTFLHRIEIQT